MLVWTQAQPGQPYTAQPLRSTPFPDPLWRLSWSPSGGNLLAVSGGDNKVYVYRPVVLSDQNAVDGAGGNGGNSSSGEGWEEVVQMEEGSWLAQ